VSLRLACVGAGPGGLFLATLVKRGLPDAEVIVLERNRPEDTFGFGVVFSDATLGAIDAADPVLREALSEHGRRWDSIEVRMRGARERCAGNGMAAVRRTTLLRLLQQRARHAGVEMRFEHEVRDLSELSGYDLVVLADGANSRLRDEHSAAFGPTAEVARAKFVWFGTTYPFEGLTFVHERDENGVFAAHAYPIGDGLSTFIVETDEETWRRSGLDAFDVTAPPGPSDEATQRYLERLFGDQIEGHPLVANNSRWASFRTRRARAWRDGAVVLLGDAAHTAHFSVGSGTKMAMEDAVALAAELTQQDDVEQALADYEMLRRPSVEKIQGSARPSLSWWENFGRYHDAFEPVQFTFHFLSRSIGRAKLAQRDPEFVARVEAWWHQQHGAEPLDTPFEVGATRLPGRRVDVRPGGNGAPRELAAGGGSAHDVRLTAVAAPAEESGLPGAVETLGKALDDGAALIAVHGGTPLTRVLLAEEARLVRRAPVLLVGDYDDDAATTLLLSGRTDLVAADRAARSVA
jgi:2-polyprenyl-6-methoxyphenol hydroxylase-like FAD-dependent oxidoreductase